MRGREKIERIQKVTNKSGAILNSPEHLQVSHNANKDKLNIDIYIQSKHEQKFPDVLFTMTTTFRSYALFICQLVYTKISSLIKDKFTTNVCTFLPTKQRTFAFHFIL